MVDKKSLCIFSSSLVILALSTVVLGGKQVEVPERIQQNRDNVELCDSIKAKCKETATDRKSYKGCLTDPKLPTPIPKVCLNDAAHEAMRCRVVTCFDQTKQPKGYVDDSKKCVCGDNPKKPAGKGANKKKPDAKGGKAKGKGRGE